MAVDLVLTRTDGTAPVDQIASLVVHGTTMEFVQADGTVVSAQQLAKLQRIDLAAPTGADAPSGLVSQAVQQTTAELLAGTSKTFQSTRDGLRRTTNSFLTMNWVLFAMGVIAFAGAVVKGLQADSAGAAVPAAVFGGLSVSAFVTVFLTQPVKSVAEAAPRNAWLLAIMNTYWTKLGYMNDGSAALHQLDAAQRALDAQMVLFVKTTSIDGTSADAPSGNAGSASSASPPAGDSAGSSANGSSPNGSTPASAGTTSN